MIKSSPNTVNTRIFCKNEKKKVFHNFQKQCQNVFVSEKYFSAFSCILLLFLDWKH